MQLDIFLEGLSLHQQSNMRSIGKGFFVQRLHPDFANLFEANKDQAALLRFEYFGKVYPLAIFFLTGQEKIQFGHCRLVLKNYSDGIEVASVLSSALQDFFNQAPESLLSALEPEWKDAPLAGVVDKRLEWSRPTDCPSDWFSDFKNDAPEVVMFPSVFHYKNPYMKELLNATLKEIRPQEKILVMGSGCGFEAALLARRSQNIVDATDINPLAVANTKATALALGVENLVRAWQSDLFEKVTEQYDLIAFNLPLALDENSTVRDQNRCDLNGKLLRKTLQEITKFLKPHGRLIIMSHEDLSKFMPENLSYKNLSRFELVHKLAISEIRAI